MQPYVLGGKDIATDVVRRVASRLLERTEADQGPTLEEIVHETIYAEHHRLSRIDPDPRSSGDRTFADELRGELGSANAVRRRELVVAIVERYVREISGHFAPRVYGATTRVLPGALGAFMHGLARSWAIPPHQWLDVDDRVLIEGQMDTLRRLAGRGTIVLAPTHVSNLDSVLLGFAIYRMGLPPFAYGAGLNLFSNVLLGFFMRNLGAYTVDRKKTDPIYRSVLKEYSTVLLERGQHSLFFPGGTRSRSGGIEQHLKMGLLGTAPTAFRNGLESLPAPGRPRPVFVVPCTLNYPVVLEAESLIEDYLRAEGGPHYVETDDEFDRPGRWVDFFRGLARLDLRVHVVIGQPMDCIGNPVDRDGHSCDPHGREVDPGRYFTAQGKVVRDDVRDAEYTRTLAARVLDAFRRDTVVLPTHVLASVLFARLRRESSQTDLFRALRALGPETSVALEDVEADTAAALVRLRKLEAGGAVRVASDVRDTPAENVILRALATFASYHVTPPAELRGQRVHATDPKLLYYYGNRLEELAS